jgi:hypothetical protein
MDTIELFGGDATSYYPPCFRQLKHYSGPDNWSARNLGHPLVLFMIGWRNFQTSLADVLDAVDGLGALRPDSKPSSDKRALLLKAHKSFIYAASELIETMIERVPEALLPSPRSQKFKVKSIDTMRRHADIICNKLKHEQNELLFIEFFYDSGNIAYGYRVVKFVGEGCEPNGDIHKSQQAFSIPLDIKRILAHIYLIAQRLGEALDHHPDFSVDYSKVLYPGTNLDPSALIGLLIRVDALTPTGFLDEVAANCPDVMFGDGRLKIRKSRATMSPRGRSGTVRNLWSGNGVTRSFQMAYFRPEDEARQKMQNLKDKKAV